MKAGQTSKRNGIQDILCPFTDIVITQGSGINGNSYSHNGTRAIDVRGKEAGIKYPCYAPFECKAVDIQQGNGQTVWKSIEKVRFADGVIDYCTVLTAHDNTINYGIGFIAKQGEQFINMGNKGEGVTGVHTHIEFAKGSSWLEKNKYGVYGLHNAVEFEEACFMDNTNIISATAKWIYLKDVPVEDNNDLKQQVAALQNKYDNLFEENEKLKEKYFVLEGLKEDLERQIKTKDSHIEKLTKLASDKDSEILNLKQEMIWTEEMYEKQVTELKAQSSYEVLFNLGKLYFCIRKD